MPPCRTCLAIVTFASIGEVHARSITFEAAREAAERIGIEVQLAERRTDVARAEVWAAGALGNPTFGVTSAKETARLGLSLAVPVPLFGQRGRAIAAAKADASAVEAEAVVVRTEIRWSSTNAWLDLFEAQSRAKQLQLAAQQTLRLEEIAGGRFDAGRGPRVDVVRAHAESARARAEAAAALLLVRAAGVRLGLFLVADDPVGLVAEGEPGYGDAAQLLDDLLGSLGRHPALRRDRAQVAAAHQHVLREERLRWPLVNAQLTVNLWDPTLPAPDVIGGLAFELPVLSLRGGAIAGAEAQRTLAALTLTLDERRLRVELLDAFLRSEAARDKLSALRDDVLPAVEEAKRMTDEAYESGRIELLRLLDAQRVLIDTRLAEIEALTTWARAVADLERSSGVDLQRRRP